MNLNFPLNSSGYGVAGYNLAKSIYTLDYSTSLFPIDQIHYQDEWIYKALNNANLFDYNSPTCRLWHQFSMAESYGKGKRLGYTFFELDKLNKQEVHHLNSLDKLLLPSQWAIDVAIDNGVNNVSKESIKCGVDENIFNINTPKAKGFPITEKTKVFLNVGKWEIRKGHDILIKMFERAFDENDDVFLIMCCFNFLNFHNYNGEKESEKWYNYYMNSRLGRAGKIFVFKERLKSQQELAQVMQVANCGIFPARAEGWNLDASEMLAMGKNVILTDYSAHTEFSKLSGCLTIPYRTSEEADDGVFFKGFGNWMEIGEQEIKIGSELMRYVYENDVGRNEKGIECFNSKITWKKSAQRIMEEANF